MNKYSVDNPVHDMGNAVTELYKVADMAEIIIEAIFNGDDVLSVKLKGAIHVTLKAV